MIIIAPLLLAPLYYVSKSKGFNAVRLVTIATSLSIGSFVAGHYFPHIGLGQLIFPALFLLTAWLLPPKEGAPGKAYFRITFTCPECKNEVTFKRESEGAAELCPECGEIVRVPSEDGSPQTKSLEELTGDHSGIFGVNGPK